MLGKDTPGRSVCCKNYTTLITEGKKISGCSGKAPEREKFSQEGPAPQMPRQIVVQVLRTASQRLRWGQALQSRGSESKVAGGG